MEFSCDVNLFSPCSLGCEFLMSLHFVGCFLFKKLCLLRLAHTLLCSWCSPYCSVGTFDAHRLDKPVFNGVLTCRLGRKRTRGTPRLLSQLIKFEPFNCVLSFHQNIPFLSCSECDCCRVGAKACGLDKTQTSHSRACSGLENWTLIFMCPAAAP